MNADNHEQGEERPLIVEQQQQQQIKGTNCSSSSVLKSKSNRSAATDKHYNIAVSTRTATEANKSRQTQATTTKQLKTTQRSEADVSDSGHHKPTSSSSPSSTPSSSPSSLTSTTVAAAAAAAAAAIASQQRQNQHRYHSFDKSNSYRGQEFVVDERKICEPARIDIEEEGGEGGERKRSWSSAKKSDEYLNATAVASANQLKQQNYSTTATNIPIVEQKQKQQQQQQQHHQHHQHHHQVENTETDVTNINKSSNEAGSSTNSAYEKGSQVATTTTTETHNNQYTNDRSANNECVAIKPLACQEIQEHQSKQKQKQQSQNPNQQALVLARKNQEAQIQSHHHQAYCLDKKQQQQQQQQHQDKQQTASTQSALSNNKRRPQDYQEASIYLATATAAETAAAETEIDTDTETSGGSLLFWKFLSNLPKSITQRGVSPPELAPEVAGYLANKLQLKQKCDTTNNNSNNNNSNINMPPSTPKTTPSSSSTATTTLTNTTPGAEKNLHSSQVDNEDRRLSDDCQDQRQQQQEMIIMNHYSANSRGPTTASRIIRIVAPKTEPSTAQIIQTSESAINKTHHHHQHHHQHQNHSQNNQDISKSGGQIRLSNEQQQQQQQNNDDLHLQTTTTTTTAATATTNQQQRTKLSIASSRTTTRSSATSLSSCILSDSASSSEQVRLKWGKKMDFLLSIIGFAVDLANIWRFPYLVYKNGGGVFLIPYLIMLIFGGIPLFFLELCLGQFVKKGPITVWNKICPSMKGVGYCSIMISWYVSFYYNVLIAWSVYFIYRSLLSFGEKMPWEDCDNSWNSKGTCVSISQLKELCSHRDVSLETCRKDLFDNVNVTSPASEFFVKELSQIDQSTGLDDMGYLRWELVFCTMIVYVLHYFSLFRGLETSGKVVWVTATAPYMILSILLVRGLYLPGATMGIKYYLSPRLEKLADPQVWIDAAGQVFYSIGVGFGVHLTYASFNSHNNNCYRDCLMTSAVNALTSVYSGLVVFVYLGYMAKNLGIEIDKVASEGYSLVFEVYPEALTTLPFARFWSILFFIMLLTLGIDSAMGGLEAVITGLEDEFRFARRLSRGQLTGLVIFSSFLPALISCTQGGAYTLFWFDIYSAGVSLLFSALFETIGVVYCYGLEKFIPNIESMLGRKPPLFYILCWKYISPTFLCGVIFMSIYTAGVPTYRGYTFPLWSIILGWCFAFSSVIAIPIVAIWYWAKRWLTSPAALSLDKSSGRKRDRGSAIVAV